ncbi:DUF3301 domain-containing protein [Parasulfuritortus cantonensis]|uniref:DUF3301 domain-containing protein n=1 Tax=Parasulfuritortus cantonensis TaxID=2528202 RepID=A0A4R1B606_9PROT|nr:DUF3301 domain-containing protein [Parasulfuritortus cantonensis]TCJ13461.1 DUF3301 domain-containing protein [Parasulfuritortus cantonensis]
MSWELVLALCLIALAWFWLDGLNKREAAIRAARAVCQRAGVQLLDETVALKGFGLGRDDDLRTRVRREFFFEYSDTGDNRLPGYVYLLGSRVLGANLIMPADKEVSDENT